jgi:glycosyltransferase involved in cell wall biosynthesis
MFEYMAAGKAILQTYQTKFSFLENNQAGVLVSNQSIQLVIEKILLLYNDKETRELLGKNALNLSINYDFKELTNNLIGILIKD